MDMQMKERFMEKWKKYFDGTNLPIAFYYSKEAGKLELVKPPSGHQCFIGILSRVQKGVSLCFNGNSIGCPGGKRYLGFTQEIRPESKNLDLWCVALYKRREDIRFSREVLCSS